MKATNKIWKWYVYVVECLDGSYYIGRTWKMTLGLRQKFSQFGSKHTTEQGIKQVLYWEECEDYEEASIREEELKYNIYDSQNSRTN